MQGAANSVGSGTTSSFGSAGGVTSTLDALREKAKNGQITIGESINLAIMEEMTGDPTKTCSAEVLQASTQSTSARAQGEVKTDATRDGRTTQEDVWSDFNGPKARSQLAADFAAENNDAEASVQTAATAAASPLLKTSVVMTSADLKARLRARGVSEAEVPCHVACRISCRISCAHATPCVQSWPKPSLHVSGTRARAHIDAPRCHCL